MIKYEGKKICAHCSCGSENVKIEYQTFPDGNDHRVLVCRDCGRESVE